MRYRVCFCCGHQMLYRQFVSNRSLAALAKSIADEGYFEVPDGATDELGQPAPKIALLNRYIVSLELLE